MNLYGFTAQSNRVDMILTKIHDSIEIPTDLDESGVQSRYTMVDVQTRDLCNAETNHNGKMLENMFCAAIASASPGSEICETARGGGLYSGDYKNLYGVLSFGFGCDNKKVSSVYTQVSNNASLHHIRQFMRNESV